MEIYKVCFTLVATILAMFSSVTFAADDLKKDFSDAYKKIEKAKPNINYNNFFKQIAKGGEEKLACCIKEVPKIVFLVCKKLKLNDGTPCLEVIENEVRNLDTLKKAGINTVILSPNPNQRIIEGVTCGEEKNIKCSGLLEEWMSRETGEFQHIRDSIVEGKVTQLITDVITYTDGDLRSTARDLNKIREYMMDLKNGNFRQICDLQGFFLKKGGFKVNDVPAIQNCACEEKCGDEPKEPTTETVFKALDQMIEAFKRA